MNLNHSVSWAWLVALRGHVKRVRGTGSAGPTREKGATISRHAQQKIKIHKHLLHHIPRLYLARAAADHQVSTLADLAGFGRVRRRGTSISVLKLEVSLMNLVLVTHGVLCFSADVYERKATLVRPLVATVKLNAKERYTIPIVYKCIRCTPS